MEGVLQNQENFEGRVEVAGRKIMLDGEQVGVVALSDHGDYCSEYRYTQPSI